MSINQKFLKTQCTVALENRTQDNFEDFEVVLNS